MSDIEELLRRSFAERSADIVASADLLDRARAVRPAARSRLWPPLQAVGAAAAAVLVLMSAWLATRTAPPVPATPPGHAPELSSPAPDTRTPATGTPATRTPPAERTTGSLPPPSPSGVPVPAPPSPQPTSPPTATWPASALPTPGTTLPPAAADRSPSRRPPTRP